MLVRMIDGNFHMSRLCVTDMQGSSRHGMISHTMKDGDAFRHLECIALFADLMKLLVPESD